MPENFHFIQKANLFKIKGKLSWDNPLEEIFDNNFPDLILDLKDFEGFDKGGIRNWVSKVSNIHKKVFLNNCSALFIDYLFNYPNLINVNFQIKNIRLDFICSNCNCFLNGFNFILKNEGYHSQESPCPKCGEDQSPYFFEKYPNWPEIIKYKKILTKSISPRKPVSLSGFIKNFQKNIFKINIDNISQDGVFITSDIPVEINELLELEFNCNKEKIKTNIEVRWLRLENAFKGISPGFGAKFINSNPQFQKTIKNFLNQ